MNGPSGVNQLRGCKPSEGTDSLNLCGIILHGKLVFIRIHVKTVPSVITRDALKGHTVSKNGSISFFFLRRSHKSVH